MIGAKQLTGYTPRFGDALSARPKTGSFRAPSGEPSKTESRKVKGQG